MALRHVIRRGSGALSSSLAKHMARGGGGGRLLKDSKVLGALAVLRDIDYLRRFRICVLVCTL